MSSIFFDNFKFRVLGVVRNLLWGSFSMWCLIVFSLKILLLLRCLRLKYFVYCQWLLFEVIKTNCGFDLNPPWIWNALINIHISNKNGIAQLFPRRRLHTSWCWSWWPSTLGFAWLSFLARQLVSFFLDGGSPMTKILERITNTDHNIYDRSKDLTNITSINESYCDLPFDILTNLFCHFCKFIFTSKLI